MESFSIKGKLGTEMFLLFETSEINKHYDKVLGGAQLSGIAFYCLNDNHAVQFCTTVENVYVCTT